MYYGVVTVEEGHGHSYWYGCGLSIDIILLNIIFFNKIYSLISIVLRLFYATAKIFAVLTKMSYNFNITYDFK